MYFPKGKGPGKPGPRLGAYGGVKAKELLGGRTWRGCGWLVAVVMATATAGCLLGLRPAGPPQQDHETHTSDEAYEYDQEDAHQFGHSPGLLVAARRYHCRRLRRRHYFQVDDLRLRLGGGGDFLFLLPLLAVVAALVIAFTTTVMPLVDLMNDETDGCCSQDGDGHSGREVRSSHPIHEVVVVARVIRSVGIQSPTDDDPVRRVERTPDVSVQAPDRLAHVVVVYRPGRAVADEVVRLGEARHHRQQQRDHDADPSFHNPSFQGCLALARPKTMGCLSTE